MQAPAVGPDAQAPTLSYVVGTLDRPDGYARLLRSIAERTPFPWELRVRDASENGYASAQSGCVDPPPLGRVHVTRRRPPDTMVEGYNSQFRLCRGRWVMWLNDDAEVMPGCAAAAVAFMESHPDVGIGAIYYQEGLGTPWRVNRWKGMMYANFGILPRAVGDRIGWFGENLRSYGSDNFLSLEVLALGLGIAAVPGSRIIHHVDANPRKEKMSMEDRSDASQFLEQRYGHRLETLKRTHDRYVDSGGRFVL